MAQTADAVIARRLLESALAFGKTTPDITAAQVTDLMTQAAVVTETGTVYTTTSLNAAAAQGWMLKAALASTEDDEIGGGGGKFLKKAVGLTERWRANANDYRRGLLDVLGGVAPGSGSVGSGSFGMIGALAAWERDNA